MNTFITCAGGTDNFNACVDWQMLMKLCYLPKLAAQLYDSQFRVLEYETGPAFKGLSIIKKWLDITIIAAEYVACNIKSVIFKFLDEQ